MDEIALMPDMGDMECCPTCGSCFPFDDGFIGILGTAIVIRCPNCGIIYVRGNDDEKAKANGN